MNNTPTVWVTSTGNSWGTSTAGGQIHTASTSKWTEQNWAEFEQAPNDEKLEIFRYLATWYGETVTTFTP